MFSEFQTINVIFLFAENITFYIDGVQYAGNISHNLLLNVGDGHEVVVIFKLALSVAN